MFSAGPLFHEDGAALVADALRANTTLTEICFDEAHLCYFGVEPATVLLGALVGHRSLRSLKLVHEEEELRSDSAEFGAALAAIIAADAPALRALILHNNALEDGGMMPLVAALPRNRHLQLLDIRGNFMSDTFVREQLLPAVRANTGLRQLECSYDVRSGSAEAEAEELVKSRQSA